MIDNMKTNRTCVGEGGPANRAQGDGWQSRINDDLKKLTGAR
jgi:hypothetical protein